eukprot:6184116-Pleurochrysis_carterae.AAC.1
MSKSSGGRVRKQEKRGKCCHFRGKDGCGPWLFLALPNPCMPPVGSPANRTIQTFTLACVAPRLPTYDLREQLCASSAHSSK